MQLYAYAPADAINRRPDLLDVLQREHDLQGIILRDGDPAAFEHVRRRGLVALWLAPGLWGHHAPASGTRAMFPRVSEWDQETFPAYESQFPMACTNTPGLSARNGVGYAIRARDLGASGVFGTHQRYHHPANLEHLWGCGCVHCQKKAQTQGIDLDEVPRFLGQLATALARLPVDAWTAVPLTPGQHPLIGWWCALTDSNFPARWFAWKNATIEQYLAELTAAYTVNAPGLSFATNGFEPLLADLVGNHISALTGSAWYAPLLGYWPHHVRASLRNLAAWHAALAGAGKPSQAEQELAELLDLRAALDNPAVGIRRQIRQGAENAAAAGRPYYPVLNGTVANQYGGRAEQFSLREGMELAREAGAAGVILQGISQLLDDPELDFWF